MVRVLALLFLVGCDPGGWYRVRNGTELGPQAREFTIATASDTQLRAKATWFTASLHVDIALTNIGTTPLVIEPAKVRVANGEGPLEWKSGRPICRGRSEESVTLAPGEICEMGMSFRAIVDKDRMATLTLAHDGVTRDGAPVAISAVLDLD